MNREFFESILFENESTTLDFKRDQYLFSGASDAEKSEILKDILAFANAWRRTEAYILIGIQENRGGKAQVVGVASHLNESDLQQFINGKTNQPIELVYRTLTYDDKQVGVIVIGRQQRPFYLKKDYGKLKQNIVYIRRGSSTDLAEPDEIAKMGFEEATSVTSPSLDLQFGNPEKRELLGSELELCSELLHFIDRDELPEYRVSPPQVMINHNYYNDYADYLYQKRLLRPFSLVVSNNGSNNAENINIEITFEKNRGFVIVDEAPQGPSRDGLNTSFRSVFDNTQETFEDLSDSWESQIEIGSIQPKAKKWLRQFYAGSTEDCETIIKVVMYADNLPNPLSVQLKIKITVIEQQMRAYQVVELARMS